MTDDMLDFEETANVKLLLVFQIDGATTITTFVNVEMNSRFLEAIQANRVRLQEFKVVGE